MEAAPLGAGTPNIMGANHGSSHSANHHGLHLFNIDFNHGIIRS